MLKKNSMMFKYILSNFFHTLRRYWVSSLLNIVGMAVAFAAFYVIITQVSYGFGYNRRVKDADRIYLLSHPSEYSVGMYNAFFSRSLGERLISCSPTVEAGGMATFSGKDFNFIREGDNVRKFPMSERKFTAGAIRIFGLEAVQGSLDELERILRSGKKVVWTMHDMWPVTGVCHHAGTCTRYHERCQDCPLLCRPGRNDLSRKTFDKKAAVYATAPITFVTCSQWLAAQAKASALTRGHQVVCIPNTYDADTFHPADPTAARQQLRLPLGKRLLLFASHKVTNAQKGLDYLLRAFRYLTDQNIGLIVVGQMAESVSRELPFPVYSMGYVADEARMAAIYQAADLFVTPSLEENLPNTIMEAMACGTPCVGFRVGGIPEMIDHQLNGYLAAYRDEQDLAAGIRWTLQHRDEAGQRAAEKALATWNERVVAERYVKEAYALNLQSPISNLQSPIS